MLSVLVTGCSKGIGRAVAAELARRGHRVVATARSVEALASLNVDQRLRLDVTDQTSVSEAVAAAEAAGPLDALVSNAGELILAPVETTPLAELRRLLEVNTIGSLRVAQAVLPAMRTRSGGRLVFMSSVAGRVSLPMVSAYSATKWALEALAEALAVEARHFGISVTLLEPGSVASGALDAPTTYLSPEDPYLPLAAQLALAGSMISVDEVAAATAAVLEQDDPPLRVPVGEPARHLLAARQASDPAHPFTPAPVAW